MRKRIYEMVDVSKEGDKLSRTYDIVLITAIFLSIIPLAFKETPQIFADTDIYFGIFFAADYLMRWMTADYKFNEKGIKPFIKYPLRFSAIVDLLSILPYLTMLNNVFKLLRIVRVIKSFKVFRVIRLFRYSKNFSRLMNVLKRSRRSLEAVCGLTVGYILVSALIIFNVEPDTFDNFLDAIYWATVSLTTIGYGDFYPVTIEGKIITMVSSIFGIAIVALPAGVITAAYLGEVDKNRNGFDDETEDDIYEVK